MKLGKGTLLGLVSGLIVGAIVLGVGGRTVMSLIAIMGNGISSWSFGGSTEVIAFGALVGAAVGVAYGLAESYLPGRKALRGLVAGTLLFGAMVLIRPPSARGAMAGFAELLLPVLLLFGATGLLFGLLLAWTFSSLVRRFNV